MELDEYVSLDAVGLSELVRRGELRADEPMQAAAAVVEKVNPVVNAVVETWPAKAVAEGPLSGVPFLVKDVGVAVAGRRSELGSRLAAGYVSPADSTLMSRFRQAGLATFGRTTSPELAASVSSESALYGVTRNPWALDRSAGGSSGGAAAAVAAGMVPVAHATDAAGSIRIPAAYCGLVGLKPTRGRVSLGPDAGEVLGGLAVQLGISRSVRDSAVLLDAVAGHAPGDPYRIEPPARPYREEVARDPGSLRVGVMTHAWGGVRTVPEVVAAVRATAALLDELGHRVDEGAPPLGVAWPEFVDANAVIWTSNLAAQIDALAAATGRPVDGSTLEPQTLLVHAAGRATTGPQLAGALATRDRATRALGQWFAEYDVLLTPTLPELPLPVGALSADIEGLDGFGWIGRLLDRSPFTTPANIAGVPAVSLPLHQDPASGLPVGLQFVAGAGREDLLLRLAGQLERALPWRDRTPAVHAGRS
ncbi:Amidase [Kribbella flavida DSM 17836]|uniref:Amidase n=1 Tax=Kribbella flavida (strain DSM 17836 / JCM 10339 / NBRC 14399) TaxID=479435 RepID=D2PSE6_KRIFD|nr:amidase [Kribbella flavida]ADB33084.1 Amidase [Kribbella flavida DSM 17836]